MLHPVGKWWKSMKHSVAWRLLKLAQHGNQFDRLKAVHQLAMIDHLKGNLDNYQFPVNNRPYNDNFYFRLGFSTFSTIM